MPLDLPIPDATARAHSERLAALIRSEIAAAGGALDFARYMELALYAPGLGYYSAGSVKFGAAGDFVTAPELGPVFARCLARAIAPTVRATGGDIFELGPGSGALASDLLLELDQLEALPKCYRLLEPSADLRERQQARIAQACPHLQTLTQWLDAPPAEAWNGALVANEVIDALPVRLFALDDDALHARCVAVGQAGEFAWRDVPADRALQDAVATSLGRQASILPRPYRSEVRPLVAPWFAAVTRSLQQGVALFADYGYDCGAYYAPERREGTLRCHYRHRAHNDPLLWPGLQDITAWVDFDALAAVAASAGFECVANSSQAQFLVEHDLAGVFADAHAAAGDERARYRLAQEVKRLTLPGEMGDVFRVVCFRR